MLNNTTGEPVDSSNLYASVSDVTGYLRSFEIDSNSNPNTTQVENIIEQKTREFERRTPTAFRVLEVSDLHIDVNPEYNQQTDIIGRNGSRNYLPNYNNGDNYVKVNLPSRKVNTLDSIKTDTDAFEEPQNVDDNEYKIDKRKGIIKIDVRAFTKTRNKSSGKNNLEDAEIIVDYKYGKSTVEPEVKEAISKLTVYDLITSDAYGRTLSEDADFVSPEELTERFKSDAEETIERFKHNRV